MKYFPHDCDAGDREWLQLLHEKFGHEGYSLWFQILEVLGKEIEKEIEAFRVAKSDKIRPIMTVGLPWLAKRCKSTTNTIKTFAAFCKRAKKYSIARVDARSETITIEVPKFLGRIDEYTRKAVNGICKKRGLSPDTVRTVSGYSRDSILLKERRGEEKRGEEKRREERGEEGASRPETTSPPPFGSAGDPGSPEQAVDEVAVTVEAFAFCLSPGKDAKRRAIEDLLRMGRSHDWIRHAALLVSSQELPFYEIIRGVEHKSIEPPFKASPPPPAKPEGPSSEDVRARLHKAQEEADLKLAAMSPGKVEIWRTEAEQEAEKRGVPAAFRPAAVKSALRLRAAETFGIEGLTAQKEMA